MIAPVLLLAFAAPAHAAPVASRDASFSLEVPGELRPLSPAEFFNQNVMLAVAGPGGSPSMPMLTLLDVSSTDARLEADPAFAAGFWRDELAKTRGSGKIATISVTKDVLAYDFLSHSDTMFLFFALQGRVLEAVCPLAHFPDCRKILGTIAPIKQTLALGPATASDGSFSVSYPDSLEPVAAPTDDRRPGATPLLSFTDPGTRGRAIPILWFFQVPLRPDLHYDAYDIARLQHDDVQAKNKRFGGDVGPISKSEIAPGLPGFSYRVGDSTFTFFSLKKKTYKAICQTPRRLQCALALKTIKPLGDSR